MRHRQILIISIFSLNLVNIILVASCDLAILGTALLFHNFSTTPNYLLFAVKSYHYAETDDYNFHMLSPFFGPNGYIRMHCKVGSNFSLSCTKIPSVFAFHANFVAKMNLRCT